MGTGPVPPPGPPHPFHPASGLPHGPPQHPHFHPHLGLEPPRPRFLFKMPRVVPNQKEKFETEDLMKRHSREGEVSKKLFEKSAFKNTDTYKDQNVETEQVWPD